MFHDILDTVLCAKWIKEEKPLLLKQILRNSKIEFHKWSSLSLRWALRELMSLGWSSSRQKTFPYVRTLEYFRPHSKLKIKKQKYPAY